MKKQIKNLESGRSMVEILGVLAVIAVLSVGGVVGYDRAVTAYRTNSAIETAQRQAAIVAGDIGLGQTVSPKSMAVIKTPSGYNVAVTDVAGGLEDIIATTPLFGVEIGGNNGLELPINVAEQMFERAVGEWQNVHAFGVKSDNDVIWLESNDNFDNIVDSNAKTAVVIVAYASDLSLRTGDLKTDGLDVIPGTDPNICDLECGECATCENGQCVAINEAGDCTTANNEPGRCTSGQCETECERSFLTLTTKASCEACGYTWAVGYMPKDDPSAEVINVDFMCIDLSKKAFGYYPEFICARYNSSTNNAHFGRRLSECFNNILNSKQLCSDAGYYWCNSKCQETPCE